MNRPLLLKLVVLAVVFGSVAILADLAAPPEEPASILDLLNDIAEQEDSQAEQQEVQPEQEEVQSQEERDTYMRIVGDLRWDELTTHDEWRAKLPGCFNDVSKEPQNLNSNKGRGCAKPFIVGGIQLVPHRVETIKNSGSRSGYISSRAVFGFRDSADLNAFRAIIIQKYPESADEPAYCSSYTCWSFGYWWSAESETPAIAAFGEATQYTKSILSYEKLDSTQF
jgi:hypothetical protein